MSLLNDKRNALIETYHYLCRRAARKFVRDRSDRGDFEQVAAIGLIKAADRYRESLGTPFEAYAWTLILGELMHYVRDNERTLRIPRRLRELDRKWTAMEQRLTGMLGREPQAREVSEALSLLPDQERELAMFRRSGATVSVETLHPRDHGELAYTLDEHFDRWMLEPAMQQLTALEREILIEIYECETPVITLAERLGYSRRHITRIHRAALDKLLPFARLASA